MRLETKGRGGKSVTVLWNFPFEETQIRDLMRTVQNKKACGASYKDGRVEFQGDLREDLKKFFTEQGWKLQQAGA